MAAHAVFAAAAAQAAKTTRSTAAGAGEASVLAIGGLKGAATSTAAKGHMAPVLTADVTDVGGAEEAAGAAGAAGQADAVGGTETPAHHEVFSTAVHGLGKLVLLAAGHRLGASGGRAALALPYSERLAKDARTRGNKAREDLKDARGLARLRDHVREVNLTEFSQGFMAAGVKLDAFVASSHEAKEDGFDKLVKTCGQVCTGIICSPPREWMPLLLFVPVMRALASLW